MQSADGRQPAAPAACSILAAALLLAPGGLLCPGGDLADAGAGDARVAVDAIGPARGGVHAAAGAVGAALVLRGGANGRRPDSCRRFAAVGAGVGHARGVDRAGAVGDSRGGRSCRWWSMAQSTAGLLVGLALVASMPVANSSVGWTQLVRGNLALSLALVLVTIFLCPWVTPWMLRLVAAHAHVARTRHISKR